MAQSAVTVRIDSELKSQFDKLCKQFGMSANTAFNVFVSAVVMQKKIPFEVQAPQNSATEDFKKAFYALRESARQNGLQDMTLDEINEEIRQARIERAKKEKASL